MSELYRHSEIRGCIATKDMKKGTLILSSTGPDIVGGGCHLNLSRNAEKNSPEFKEVSKNNAQALLKNILTAFHEMSNASQDEYMKLPNRLNDTRSIPESDPPLKYLESLLRSMDQDFDKKDLEIIAIYVTNLAQVDCVEGVNIKMSQFHHSCHPNAVVIARKNLEIRAIRKIKAGDEITINRSSSSLLGIYPRKERLELLYETEYFICSCEICQGFCYCHLEFQCKHCY